MTLNSWQQLAELKANLIEVAEILLNDEVSSRQEIALGVLRNLEIINLLEEKLIRSLNDNEIKELYKKCEKIKQNRDKKPLDC